MPPSPNAHSVVAPVLLGIYTFLHTYNINPTGTTLHIRQLAGKNSHHIVEATFKAFARALRRATEYDERRAGQIASSKGVLTQQ